MERKLNVLYVVPRYRTYGMDGHYVMPMGLLYVSAYVKRAGVANVFTLNLNHTEGPEYDVLSSFISAHRIDVVGTGGLSGEYADIARIVGYVRRISPHAAIMVGGGLVTADAGPAMLALPEADYGIIGEGEVTSVELLEALSRSPRPDLEKVDGLIYRCGGRLHVTGRRAEIRDLDSLPLPDYEGFCYGEYLRCNPDLSDEGKRYSQVSVIGGRSCKYNCTFCFHPSGTTYRQRSLDSIFGEIDWLVSHYDISYIALREELFATDNRRVADFCKRVAAYDFDWSIQLRIDSISPELVGLLEGTRCRYVFVGIESAHDQVLASMRKGITLSRIEEALALLKEAGLRSRSGVIFGDSAETLDTARWTLDWFGNNCGRYRMFADMIIAFPGSVLYRRARRDGVIPDAVQFLKDGCPIVNVSSMTDSEFARVVEAVEHISGRHYNVKYYRHHE